jgi:hypothetical protein
MDSIRRTLMRIKADILALRNLDAYIVAALAIVLAILGIVEVGVSTDAKLAVILAALGLLVFNLTVPAQKQLDLDEVLQNRSAYTPFPERIKGARTLWIYAASAVNILSDENLQAIREEILNRPDGQLRVIIQDPAETESMRLLIKQLDESVDYPVQHMNSAVQDTQARFERIQKWKCPGKFEFGFLSYNPGFSLVVIDPTENQGAVIPEFYGFHNEHTGSRMHIEITRKLSQQWYDYWVSQFDYMWDEARKPGETEAPPES